MRSLAWFQRVDYVDGTAYPLPITLGNATAWRWVYRADLQGVLCEGDVLDVTAEHEFTNDTGIRVELVTAITLTNGGPYYDEDLCGGHATPTQGVFICKPNGGDFTRGEEHHRPITRSGAVVVPGLAFSPVATILFRARARSDAANSGGAITIEPSGYGHMTIKVYR